MTEVVRGVTPWSVFIDQWRDDWNRLAAEVDAPPDLTPDWLQALVDTGRASIDTTWVAWACRDGRLRAVWPFRLGLRRKFGLQFRVLESLQNLECHHAGFMHAADDTDAATALLQAIRESGLDWDFIEIARARRDSDIAQHFTQGARAGGHGVAIHDHDNGPPYLDLLSSWSDYLAGQSANFRSNLKRRQKRLQEAGRFEIRHYDSASRDAFFALMLEIERHTWKHAQGTSIAAQDWELALYQRVLALDQDRYKFIGLVAMLDDQPLAHYLLIRHGDDMLGLKHSFHEGFAKLSPGTVLKAHALEQAYAMGCRRFDFLGNAEDHKLLWTQVAAMHRTLRVYSNGFWGRALSLYERVLR